MLSLAYHMSTYVPCRFHGDVARWVYEVFLSISQAPQLYSPEF